MSKHSEETNFKSRFKNGITVVIPAYNSEATITKSLGSCKGIQGCIQTIVVDDGSTDSTNSLARTLGATVISQTNQGASIARVQGLKAVLTEYVIFLDADDLLVDQGVQESIAVLEENHDFSAACGRTRVFPSGKLLNFWEEGINFQSLISRGFSPGPPGSLVWRTEKLLESIFLAPPLISPRYAEDYEWLLRTANIGIIGSHKQVSVIYAEGGGKSYIAPMESIRCADQLRCEYSKISGVTLKPLSDLQIRSMLLFRQSVQVSGSKYFLKKILLQLLATFCSPSVAIRKIKRKIKSIH